ncbi:hypothetical protein [Bradyrhizobium liaoningense]|uniref:hypothetical protein n=1 Tax=Bradyrhizobium liaoningense TaxID=43992 RepID=UPI000556EAFD|nr:hypothetical protein [Bradyrhizobium liaoningense]
MFRVFLTSLCKFVPVLPVISGSLYALREAAAKAGFDAQFPVTHDKFTKSVNYLVYILVEHTIWYVIFCALAAFIWALIVAEPKAVSKRKFEERRLKLRS